MKIYKKNVKIIKRKIKKYSSIWKLIGIIVFFSLIIFLSALISFQKKLIKILNDQNQPCNQLITEFDNLSYKSQVSNEEIYQENKEKEEDSLYKVKFNSKYIFEDFSVNDIFKGTPAPVNFTTKSEAKKFHTVITEGAARGPNFAGHYTFIYWGCGSSCQSSVVVDAITGKIYDGLPSSLGYDFKVDSSLLILKPPDKNGFYDSRCLSCRPELYLWEDVSFKELDE